MVQVAEIHPNGRQGLVYPAWSQSRGWWWPVNAKNQGINTDTHDIELVLPDHLGCSTRRVVEIYFIYFGA